MTPSDVAQHPSVLAVRDQIFDFSYRTKFQATCAVCNGTASAMAGERGHAPCDNANSCGFILDATRTSTHDIDRRNDPVVAGAKERFPRSQTVWVNYLPVPSPPTDHVAWQTRRDAVFALAPELTKSLASLPIGWFGLIELAAHALASRSLGSSFVHSQSKEKFGTARIYAYPVAGVDHDDEHYRAAVAILHWTTGMTESTCAKFGTPDGLLRDVGGWWITLGEQAWDVVSTAKEKQKWNRSVLDLYPEWARPV